MRFDPDAVPFWEVERGDGPLSRAKKSREIQEAKAQLRELEHEIPLARADQPQTDLPPLLEKRNRLLDILNVTPEREPRFEPDGSA